MPKRLKFKPSKNNPIIKIKVDVKAVRKMIEDFQKRIERIKI